MLDKETTEYIKTKIKEINKLKNIDERLDEMIKVKDNVRSQLNDHLDEFFSTINLKKIKINLEE